MGHAIQTQCFVSTGDCLCLCGSPKSWPGGSFRHRRQQRFPLTTTTWSCRSRFLVLRRNGLSQEPGAPSLLRSTTTISRGAGFGWLASRSEPQWRREFRFPTWFMNRLIKRSAIDLPRKCAPNLLDPRPGLLQGFTNSGSEPKRRPVVTMLRLEPSANPDSRTVPNCSQRSSSTRISAPTPA